MSKQDTSVDIEQLLSSIRGDMQKNLPNVPVFDGEASGAVSPDQGLAIQLDVLRLDPDRTFNPGTEQTAVSVVLQATVLVAGDQLHPTHISRSTAISLASRISWQRWGCSVGPAELDSVAPKPVALEGFHPVAWAVTWKHAAFLGRSLWDSDRIPARFVAQLGNAAWRPKQPTAEQVRKKPSVVLAVPSEDKPDQEWIVASTPHARNVHYGSGSDQSEGYQSHYHPLEEKIKQ
ncbi:hypothetical protein HEQ60_10345 [Haematospirillum sp. H1815]|nr:hypothetical protein [Haematospirillum sp. H1815]